MGLCGACHTGSARPEAARIYHCPKRRPARRNGARTASGSAPVPPGPARRTARDHRARIAQARAMAGTRPAVPVSRSPPRPRLPSSVVHIPPALHRMPARMPGARRRKVLVARPRPWTRSRPRNPWRELAGLHRPRTGGRSTGRLRQPRSARHRTARSTLTRRAGCPPRPNGLFFSYPAFSTSADRPCFGMRRAGAAGVAGRC
jgi:hypothetical protein